MTRLTRTRVLPGFGLTLGFTITYLSIIVILPLAVLFARVATEGDAILRTLTESRVLNSLALSFGAAFAGAAINAVFGFILAWALVRYRFPLRRLLDGIVDLPFALPTAVSGIALTTLYAKNGLLGRTFEAFGVQVAYTRLGVIVALTFIGVPFVVRTLQPAIEDLEAETEEAAATLGANRWEAFRRVIFPALFPSWLTGFALAFARAVGEYGSVIFIAGNIPNRTEIAPLLIVIQLEQYDYVGAMSIAIVMLAISFLLLLAINVLQRRSRLEAA